MKYYIFAWLLAAATLQACDDGRIEERRVAFEEGRVVKLTGRLTGLANWADGYTVALAGFDDADDYAIISKAVPTADAADNVSVVLSAIGDNVTNVQLCVLDRLRRHVMTFSRLELPQTTDTVFMEVGEVDASMLGAIQQGYFSTTCANCHGASNYAAAGLYLTEGRSYAAMVGVPSVKVEGLMIVEPGNAAQSVLHQALNSELTSTWREYHRDLVSEKHAQSILPLIDSWINNGAKEN